MWGVIAIIILVYYYLALYLNRMIKHQLEVKEYEIEVLRDKLENGG